jgi:hypothetical protein
MIRSARLAHASIIYPDLPASSGGRPVGIGVLARTVTILTHRKSPPAARASRDQFDVLDARLN